MALISSSSSSICVGVCMHSCVWVIMFDHLHLCSLVLQEVIFALAKWTCLAVTRRSLFEIRKKKRKETGSIVILTLYTHTHSFIHLSV